MRTCNAFGLALVVLVDTPGFMPGPRQEAAGVIRRGARVRRGDRAEGTVVLALTTLDAIARPAPGVRNIPL